jgi:hypothetical protein
MSADMNKLRATRTSRVGAVGEEMVRLAREDEGKGSSQRFGTSLLGAEIEIFEGSACL